MVKRNMKRKFAITLFILIVATVFSTKNIYAARCEAFNITSSSFDLCAGEFETEEELQVHGLHTSGEGSCDNWHSFSTDATAQDGAGFWYTCSTYHVIPSCQDKNLSLKVRLRTAIGLTWCSLSSLNLSEDAGCTIDTDNGNSCEQPMQPTECSCPLPWQPSNFTADFCTDHPPLDTALGCFPTHPLYFLAGVRRLFVGAIGGVALLTMVIGAFFVLTSRGDVEQIKRGREVFSRGITGVIIMIFAWLILNLITREFLDLFI